MCSHLGYKRRDAEKLEARRFAAIARLERGESAAAVARSMGVCIQSVQRWALWYKLRGEEGLRRRAKTGGPRPKLDSENLAQLRELLADGPHAHGFDTPVWTTERVAGLIWRRFGVRYSRDHVKHRLLPSLGWKWHKHTWMPADAGADGGLGWDRPRVRSIKHGTSRSVTKGATRNRRHKSDSQGSPPVL